MRVGFTGTRDGMTDPQAAQVGALLEALRWVGATQAMHGLCKGADEHFHHLARAHGYFLIGCPGVTHTGLAYLRSSVECDMVKRAKPFLVRDKDIVTDTDVLIATPKEQISQHRSGTWTTIRYAREAQKPLLLIWPDGSSLVEQVAGVETAEGYRNRIRGEARWSLT